MFFNKISFSFSILFIFRMLAYDQEKRSKSEDLINYLEKSIINKKYKRISFIENDDGCIYLVESIEDKKK